MAIVGSRAASAVALETAQRIASDLAARTGAPAPYGVPPGAYLAAVVHERQAREARQAFQGAAGAGALALHVRLGDAVYGDLVQRSESELNAIPNFGKRSTDEVKDALHAMGLGLRDE